ncbi:hypothetical protein DFQ11_105156 [Winogradskyella epiphytica]|uniref:DUF4412 domain-containing protein n=1 Tax=Winogradskyella epiphytica TaxID=262005 RepID=A0A2V4YBW2_9FLAO|nr:hypothetical protein [Winogradskyella epiphytica]PYE80557.1 hypothetical protein DFQ11_105156 [Winogradskyella epiphytica]GGW68631.1 hypothetical protein GCM10008085_20600 [Winogradskyella epiphytica]
MKTKHILFLIIGLLVGGNAEAQILKKLRKKAEQAAERTILRKTDEIVTKKTEKTIDDATSKNEKKDRTDDDQTNDVSDNSALELNTKAKQDFYKEDMVIELFENNAKSQTQYFDKDEVAVKLNQDNQPKSGYIDSEGFIYAYNEAESQYFKSSIIQLQSQGLMVPTMMLEAYKLPPEPFLANLDKQQDLGLTPNPFNGIVEFAFIYEPEHFRYEDFKESKKIVNGKQYIKFDFLNEPGYEGSYVLFDDKDRLVEIYSNKTSANQSQDNFEMGIREPSEGRILYDYKPVEIKLPSAREKKMAGQGLMEMVMGSNKKDSKSEDYDEEDYDTTDSKGMIKSAKKSMKNNKVTADMLPESYEFDYVFKTTLVQNSKKQNALDMNFLINTNTTTYSGSEYIDPKLSKQGTMYMVFDLDLNVMAMFINGHGGNNMVQITNIPEVDNKDVEVDFTITELPPKTIIGFKSTGLQLENDTYILKVYHTKNAPVTLSNFFGFGGSSSSKKLNLPEMDSRLLKQFENGLVMEMHYEDKKKKKNNFIITAKSLDKTSTTIQTKNYKSLNMFSGGNLFQN